MMWSIMRVVLLGILLGCGQSVALGHSIERLSLFVSDGTTQTELSPIGGGANADTLDDLGISGQWLPSCDINHYCQWQWILTNQSGATLRDLRLTTAIDVDITAADNTYFNATGALVDLPAQAGVVVADRWEIAEPGYLKGDLLQRAAQGTLNNQIDSSMSHADDAMLALSLPVKYL